MNVKTFTHRGQKKVSVVSLAFICQRNNEDDSSLCHSGGESDEPLMFLGGIADSTSVLIVF